MSYFIRLLSALVFIVGLYLVSAYIFMCMYIFKYIYMYSIYTHFIKNKKKALDTRILFMNCFSYFKRWRRLR